MKPVRFDYASPMSVEALLLLLSRHGPNAALLAGGQSLMPLLNRRRLRPDLLIDLNRVADIDGIRARDSFLRIGAMTRQREIEYSGLVAKHVPLLTKAIKFVGNPATRNRGTLGGSVAFADPHAELPACMVCLRARFVLASQGGTRQMPAADFFRGRHKTAMLPTEALLSIDIPTSTDRTCAFLEISRRARDQAIVGVAARVQQNDEAIAVLFGVAEQPIRIDRIELDEDWPILHPLDDETLSNLDRQRIARTLARRAFREMNA